MKTEKTGAANAAPVGTNDSEETMQVEGGKPFPARRYLIKVQGKQDYLPVAARIAWIRHDHPDWGITTNAIEINFAPSNNRSPYAIFQATITNEKGNIIAQGTKMEDAKGFPDFLEKAETGAIGRAIANCGYGTLQCLDMDEGIERAANPPQGSQRAASGQQRVPDAPEPDNQYNEPFPDDEVEREKANFYAVCKQLDIRVPNVGEEKRIINHVLKRTGDAGEVPPTAQEYNAAAARLPKIMAAQARKAKEEQEKEAAANGK